MSKVANKETIVVEAMVGKSLVLIVVTVESRASLDAVVKTESN